MHSSHIFCSNCGVKNQRNAGFCFNCGNQLTHLDAAANTFPTPDNVAGSGQQVPAPPIQVLAPPRALAEAVLPQGAKPPITNPGDLTPSDINNATGFLPTNTILKQRYRVLHTVGRGGMGAVYMGEDMQLGNRLVAIKEMSQASFDPQEIQMGIDNFKREAHLLAGLQHPNLPSIYDHFEQNQRWYLVMSFIQGETLQDHLNYIPGGKIPLEEVLKIGTELCSVLHYLHTYQPPIIFRDLKPSNIMRDKNGHIYLIDFGIARHFKPGQEKDTASYATVGYAAPEQYGRAQTTPRSDIYSLGATLYYLISGYAPSQSPFRLPPLQSLAPTLPLRLTGLITHMLDLEENRRPPDMMAVKQELQATTSSPAIPSKKKKPAGQPSSGAAPQMAAKPARARTAHPIQLKKILARAFAVLSSVLCLIGLGLAIGGTGTAWYVYFGSYYQDISSGNTVPTLITSYIIVLLDMGSLILLLGFFTLYIPWTKNLSIATMTPISTRRKTIAKVGVFLGCILLIWGIWGWAHASPYFYNSSNNTDRTFDSSQYISPTLGFAFIALTGTFIILATTMRSFGLSHTKSKKEMAQRITTILATFTLLFGTTFLLPETVVVAIICFLIGGGVLIATQLEQ